MAQSSSEATIAVMGATGSGKSTFINLVSGSDLAVNDGLRSCTSVVQTSNSFPFEGRAVTLIDTPGFDDTTRTDTDILRTIADYLTNAYQNNKKLNGVLYIHRILDVRMGGIALRNFRMFRALCGDASLKNVIVVTNMWGEVSPEVGAARERELMTDGTLFKPVLEKGARMHRHANTLESAHAILRLVVGAAPAVLQVQDELVNQGRVLAQTTAGTELESAVQEEIRRHQLAVEQAQRELAAAVAAREEETRREMEAVRRRAEEEEARAREEHQRVIAQQERDRALAEQQQREVMRRLEEEARLAREAAEQARRLQEEADRAAREWAQEQEQLRQTQEYWRNQQNHQGDGGCRIF